VRELQFTRALGGWRFDACALAEQILDCDLLLCLNPWHGPDTSNLLHHLPDAESIGFFRGFHHQIACDYHGHAIDMAFAIPAYLDSTLVPAQFAGPPAISPSTIARAQEFRRCHVRSEFSLFVHTDTRPQKCWPPERFAQAINRFLRDHSDFTALIVDLHKRWIGDVEFADRVVPFSLPLDVSLALLRDCDLFLGVDSCHLHAADLFGVPGVALFGPTRCRRWGYRFTDHWHLQGAQRMDSIGVDDVFTALRRLALSARSHYQRTTCQGST
jgi:ADP-heptose:LPS heptosyltransferase